MKLAVLLGNPLVQRPGYTTICLAFEAYRRGHAVGLVGVDGLTMTDGGRLMGRALSLPAGKKYPVSTFAESEAARADFLADLLAQDPEWWDLGACEVVLLRLLARPKGLDEDDGRYDTFYRSRIEAALAFAQRLASETPAWVVNDPVGVWQTSGKFFLSLIDNRFRPKTIITRDAAEIRHFIAALDGPAVVKPMLGHGGEDVFRLTPNDPNFNSIVTSLLRQGYLVVQEWLAEVAQGERRILLLDGRPILGPNGVPALYRRQAAANEWRANIHVGGQPMAGELFDADAEIIAHLGPLLRRYGLYFVGLDLIGHKLLEINAFCPGGINLVHKTTGFDAAPAVLDDMERRLAERGA